MRQRTTTLVCFSAGIERTADATDYSPAVSISLPLRHLPSTRQRDVDFLGKRHRRKKEREREKRDVSSAEGERERERIWI